MSGTNVDGEEVPAPRAEATELLARGSKEPRAADRLLPLVYAELRAIAARYLRSERVGSTLQPTALVHEAYLRLIENERIDWKGKTHFMAMAATQMRRILVDRARARGAKKRGGGDRRITLTETLLSTAKPAVDLLALDQALERLAARSARQGRVAELKLFTGLLSTEIAFSLGVSERTVKEDWRVARAWLMKELAGTSAHS